jgi:hypothetical protein
MRYFSGLRFLLFFKKELILDLCKTAFLQENFTETCAVTLLSKVSVKITYNRYAATRSDFTSRTPVSVLRYRTSARSTFEQQRSWKQNAVTRALSVAFRRSIWRSNLNA